MTALAGKLLHGSLAAALLLIVMLAAFLISTRGATYPNPADRVLPARELAVRAQAQREAAQLILGLRCLDAVSRGKHKDAIKHCDLAMSQNPDDVALLKLRGTAYSALHRDALALADFNRAVALAPADPGSLELRGYFHETRGRYALAIADFLASLKIQPGNYHAWNSLCWTRFLANTDSRSALAACDRSIALNPAYANGFDSRGYVQLRLARYRAALADFNRALALRPKLAPSLFGRGVAKARLGDRSGGKDIAAAKAIEPGIEQRFFGYGIRVPAGGPSGT